MTTKELVVERLDAELHEAGARLDVLKARAEAHKAQGDMDEISGLRAARERASQKLADLRRHASADGDAARRDLEAALHDVRRGIERVEARHSEWDDASKRRFSADLDEAEAKARVAKARAAETRAAAEMKGRDTLASLEERVSHAWTHATGRPARSDREAQ